MIINYDAVITEKGKYTLTIEKDSGQYDPDFDEEEETDE